MIRRRSTSLSLLTAVLVLSAWSLPTLADSLTNGQANYTLTINNGSALPDPGTEPSNPASLAPNFTPQVLATISPVNSVPVVQSTSPVTIQGGSGFNPNGVLAGIRLSNNGQTEQLGLTFFDTGPGTTGGLAANGQLQFSLDVDKAVTSTPPIVTSTTPGVTITPQAQTLPSTPPANNNAGSTVNTPEPLSVLLWSVLAGFGLLRARAARRSRLAPS